MQITIPNEKGNITIDNQVIATIAGVSAMESYGVVGMASKNATDGIFQLLKFENLTRGIEVYTDNERVHILLRHHRIRHSHFNRRTKYY